MRPNAPTEPLRVPSLVDVMYVALRNAVLTNALTPDVPITEVDLATRYSVARPTAKAAMERLVQDGLLRRATNKSARVPLLNVDDIKDIYFVRGLLEREVIATLARRGLVPAGARESLEALKAGLAEPQLTEVVELDIEFHRSLVDALDSYRLGRLYSSLMGEVHLCMAQVQSNHLLHPALIAEEHEAILDAIAEKNEKRAVREITSHLQRACTRLTAHVEERERAS